MRSQSSSCISQKSVCFIRRTYRVFRKSKSLPDIFFILQKYFTTNSLFMGRMPNLLV